MKKLLVLLLAGVLALCMGARKFDVATNSLIRAPLATVTNLPFTISSWIKNENSSRFNLIVLMAGAWATEYYYAGATNNQIIFAARRGVNNFVQQTAVASSIDWHQYTYVFEATNRRVGYFDGTPVVTNTGNCANPAGINNIMVGRFLVGSGFPSDGHFAHIALWDVALTASEAATLSKFSPLLVRPASLKFYAPLEGVSTPEADVIGLTISITNTVTKTQGPVSVINQ